MFDSGYRAQYMNGQKEKFVRLEESSPKVTFSSDASKVKRSMSNINGDFHGSKPSSNFIRGEKSGGSEGIRIFGRSFRFGASRAVFSEDLKTSEKKIFDPEDQFLLRMNRLFVISCIFALAVDPLFFYIPFADMDSSCLGLERNTAIASTIVRTIVDSFYLIRMALQFRTAYVAPSSLVFGRGELVIDPKQIADRYLKSNFIIDFLSVLPLPQIVIWNFLQQSLGSDVLPTKNALFVIVLLQYVPRFLRILPLQSEMIKTTGAFAESSWAGAVYYLVWFMLVSHIVGSFWYFLSVAREGDCWDYACNGFTGCDTRYLYCGNSNLNGFDAWSNVSQNVLTLACNANNAPPLFSFGIYSLSLNSGVISSKKLVPKVWFCFWWGLQSVSTLGQGLMTTTYLGEVIFSIGICVLGLILFALIISNMQTYMQSITQRLDEMRVRRRDSEQWMRHRMLPHKLRERVRRYFRYRWVETRGVDEEGLIQNLPKDLRRDIKHHLCLALVKSVPLFQNMDETLLDAICERLKPALYTEQSYIVREGDPVDEMILIIHGCLESVTTDGGRVGFFNREFLNEGNFCGEELLTWALEPKAGGSLPTSTRTVIALTEVEAFSLNADELTFVTSQFRRLHSRQVQDTFRYYSPHWRTWAATFIQVAWRNFASRKMAELKFKEGELAFKENLVRGTSSLAAAIYASRFASNALRVVHRSRSRKIKEFVKVQKPSQPDFDADDAN